MPEFQRPTLESLRQPLESGRAVVARDGAELVRKLRQPPAAVVLIVTVFSVAKRGM